MAKLKPRTAYFPTSLALEYHERSCVSLLSSGWDQVVPMLYGRQAIRCCAVLSPHGVKGWFGDRNVFYGGNCDLNPSSDCRISVS